MQQEKVDQQPVEESVAPNKAEEEIDAAPKEADFHKSIDALSDAQSGMHVLHTVEDKFKGVLEAFVAFMESLKLDEKMTKLVAELEPTFAKFEAHVIEPLNQFSQKASRGLQHEIDTFQVEINQLKDRLQQRLQHIRSRPGSPAPSAPLAEQIVPPQPQQAHQIPQMPQPIRAPSVIQPAAHSAMKDLQTLESMGFTDRRRNLELLAQHNGDLNLVVERLLA